MQSNDATFFIQHLHLQPHPESGWYKETYRAFKNIKAEALPKRFAGDRSFSTAINYSLEQGNYSAFHQIKSDECWPWYARDTLLIYIIEKKGNYYCVKLSNDLDNGEVFQFVVPAAAWFTTELSLASHLALTGCTVSPGLCFSDFELAEKKLYSQPIFNILSY